MNKTLLAGIIAGLLSFSVHADWDPVREARDQAEQMARQEQSAREKAAHQKQVREGTQRQMRAYLGKDASGKSDAEVERIYNKRQSDAVKQAAAFEAAMKTAERPSKKRGEPAAMEQGDAAMKAMYGKSVNDIGNMSEKEREAFFKDLEKKYPK